MPTQSQSPSPDGILHLPFGTSPSRMHDFPTAARLIGLAPATLEVDRSRKRLDLRWFKVGRRVLYKEADLVAFLDRCAVEA